ncbi:MAG: sigma-54 dependent transcriptional regulator [Gemmatimonadales bacterium]
MVRLSPSFADTVRGVVKDLGFEALDRDGATDPPADLVGVLVLGGGAEADAVDWLASHPPRVPTYLLGADPDHRLAVGAVARGARDFFALPGDLDLFRRTLERLARETDPAAREAFTRTERDSTGFGAIVGRSPALGKVLHQARRAAAVRDVTVLIGGETGTGKELLARAIHLASVRADDPFVEINCAAIPSNLLESELFGHEKGAFTGAVAAKPGLLELADRGTLFLDEVATLPLELQPKLLRALETREIRRVGGNSSRKIDVRVVCATHVDLGEAVANGAFREDLYYRLNVLPLVLPPLRDRGEDIELLAETFVTRLAGQYELPVPPLGAEVRSALRAHPWPGNIRELRNAIERGLVLSPPGQLLLDDLLVPAPAPEPTGALPFPAPLSTIIRAAVLETVARVDGNKSEAARRLGISRPRLQRILDGDPEG